RLQQSQRCFKELGLLLGGRQVGGGVLVLELRLFPLLVAAQLLIEQHLDAVSFLLGRGLAVTRLLQLAFDAEAQRFLLNVLDGRQHRLDGEQLLILLNGLSLAGTALEGRREPDIARDRRRQRHVAALLGRDPAGERQRLLGGTDLGGRRDDAERLVRFGGNTREGEVAFRLGLFRLGAGSGLRSAAATREPGQREQPCRQEREERDGCRT